MSQPAGIVDPLVIQELLGYLNFSSGTSDPAFLRRLNELWQAVENAADADSEPWRRVQQLLTQKLADVQQHNPAFHDSEQAERVLQLLFDRFLPAYREHHRDLLFHQSDADLWRPFFIGRVAEALIAAGGPWDETERIVDQALRRVNDFVGYRPVPVLENHRHEPYPHERVRPIPLYIAGAGCATGPYQKLIEQTLAILRQTNADLLESAWFELDALDELAVDPRAYDFNHPVNRRPNYHFGQWDPDLIDSKGRYRRFVIQQCTLDAVLARVGNNTELPPDEVLFEAGAVLSGTILMASGTTGAGPETHDSSVSLATLLPHIAQYRDEFYHRLFARLEGPHRKRLEQEAAARRQPFAGARQHLNGELARLRALQMQHVHLAVLFARLGFPEAATRQADIVPAASSRMVCQLQCLLTGGHRAIDTNRLNDALAVLPQAEDLLRRAIECGAVLDPWSILGFGGQFSLFPAMENSIPDPRVDELFDLVEQIFALYARLWHTAATSDNHELEKRIPPAFRKPAAWWDRFATGSISGMRSISGAESVQAAQHVATALAAWHKAGEAARQVSFWRPHIEEFHSPQAYGRVIEVLLDHHDLPAAMALLMNWLSQADTVRLDDQSSSFYALCLRWMRSALHLPSPPGRGAGGEGVRAKMQHPHPGPLPKGEGEKGAGEKLIAKFFDFLEANADMYWDVPQWQPSDRAGANLLAEMSDSADDEEAELTGERDDDDEDLFSAAYENMVYRDSTADGVDADMLEGASIGGDNGDELEGEQRRLFSRLAFLGTLAALWKQVGLTSAAARWNSATKGGDVGEDPNPKFELPENWVQRAAENRHGLLALAVAVQRYPITVSSASYEASVEYDRRRLIRETLLEKIIGTISATADAELLLTALEYDRSAKRPTKRRPSGSKQPLETADDPTIVRFWSALLAGDVKSLRRDWADFLASVSSRPLLYVPLGRGGDVRKIAAARGLQQVFRECLQRLPRLGLLRETCQLLRVARDLERQHTVGPGAVTEFDRLFEVGYKSIVECLVDASLSWADPESEGDSASSWPSDRHDAAAADAQLIDCLQLVTESLLTEWLSHSRTLRLSVLERVTTPKAWQELVQFIERYGHDLFTQQFFHLGNLRGIMYQGVDAWLDHLAEDDEAAEQLLLVRELDHGLSRAAAKKHLALVVEAVIENYTEYRDYNATTTQSDRGEMLHSLLDFLRVKVGYERIHWNLRPVIMAHEVLIRRGCDGAAELWRRAMAERTSDVADQQLERLAKLQTQYGMRLPTIADRLSERFVRPLTIDRVRALVAPAANEARTGAPPNTFELLEQETGELAQEPCGAGLDLPDWLETLDEEVNRVANRLRGYEPATEAVDFPHVELTWDEIQSQLADWDAPQEDRSRKGRTR